MFLPVLLIRDFGIWGWVVFAIPNVIGAALVGKWRYDAAAPVTDCGASSRQTGHIADDSLLQKHRRAMVWFSIVTVFFHVFFVSWFVERLIGSSGTIAFILAVIVFSVFIKQRRIGLGAWLTFLVSVAIAGVFLLKSGSRPVPEIAIGTQQSLDLLYTAPAIFIGFMFCPHLDLTLQHARLSMTPKDAKPTFNVAYYGLFLLMIIFTLGYATTLMPTLATGHDKTMPRLIALALGLHLAVQSGFTVSVHSEQLLKVVKSRHFVRGILTCFIIVVALLLLGRAVVPGSRLLGYDPGEVIYRIFIGFYGLVFPAYAWSAWVWRDQAKFNHAAWLLPVLIALPMFTAGFMTTQPIWIVPGTLIVLLLPWLILPRRPQEAQATIDRV